MFAVQAQMITYCSARDYSYFAEDNPAVLGRIDDPSRIPWLFGVPTPRHDGLVVHAHVDPDMAGDVIPDVFLTGRSLASAKALAVFEQLGIDNLELYDAVIHTSEGQQLTDYKAFYVIGALACMHRNASEFAVLRPGRTSVRHLVIDADQTMDMPLFRLAEDPLWLIMADYVRAALDAAGVTGLYYTPLESR